MVSTTDGRIRQQNVVSGGGTMSEHTGTSSPSPAGSTYTTASESGGPNTIESEPGTYLSASEDLVNLPPRITQVPTSGSGATTLEAAYAPVINYNQGYCNSAEVTMIPQHTVVAPHDLRVSSHFTIFIWPVSAHLFADTYYCRLV